MVRLAGLLDDPRLAALLWERVLPPAPPELRAGALSALGKWAESPSKEQRARLFRCAAEPDFRVAAPALMLLDKLPVNDKSVPEWLDLFGSPGLAGRRLALAKVGGRDLPAVAEALASQLGHPDRSYREEVLAQLARTEHGRKQLAARLVEVETADAAWPLARALAPLAAADPDAWADELFPRAAKYLETGDRRADPLLFVLREGGAAGLRDRLAKKAAALVAKKAFGPARLLYHYVTRDPAAGFPYRMALAACGLKVSAKELSAGGADAGSLPGPVRGAGAPRRRGGTGGAGEDRLAGRGGPLLPGLPLRGVLGRRPADLRCRGAAPAHQPIPAHQARRRGEKQTRLRRPGREEGQARVSQSLPGARRKGRRAWMCNSG